MTTATPEFVWSIDDPRNGLEVIETRLKNTELTDAPPLKTIDGIPMSLVEQYAAAAARHAIVREADPGVWVASVVGLDGAYADEDSPAEALAVLPGVIVDWVAVRLRFGATDIPAIEGLDINRRKSE